MISVEFSSLYDICHVALISATEITYVSINSCNEWLHFLRCKWCVL